MLLRYFVGASEKKKYFCVGVIAATDGQLKPYA
jgi:hypothetical protein